MSISNSTTDARTAATDRSAVPMAHSEGPAPSPASPTDGGDDALPTAAEAVARAAATFDAASTRRLPNLADDSNRAIR